MVVWQTSQSVWGPSADCSKLEVQLHCTESSVAEVGARPTDEKRTSISGTECSEAGVGDEPAVISQVAGSVFR